MKEAYVLGAIGALEGVWKYCIQPELTAGRAWATIGLGVLAYELVTPPGELLSEGVDRAIAKYPILTRAAVGYTALHLMNLLPEPVDLFHHVTKNLTHK